MYNNDDTWSLKLLDEKLYEPENSRRYGYVSVVTDHFNNFGWTVPLKIKLAQTTKDSFINNLITSKRKPNFNETDVGKEMVNKIFTGFLNKNKIERYIR